MDYETETDMYERMYEALMYPPAPKAKIKLTPREKLEKSLKDNHRHFNFSMELVRYRRRKHLSQRELANLIGTTQSVIAEVEGKRGNPRLDTLLLIAEALGVQLRLGK